MGRPKTGRRCSVEGCDRKHAAKGWCHRHYYRAARHGDPLLGGGEILRGITDLERLEHYSRRDPRTGCLEWTGGRTLGGYGSTVGEDGVPILAHRLALRVRGEDIDGKVVRHLVCDNPPCIEPDHLATGTYADNSGDMVRKGRQSRAFATAVSHAVYVEYAIRSLDETAVVPKLALKYGTSTGSIYRAIRKWKELGLDRSEVA